MLKHQSIISVSLAALVLMASSSFMVGLHFCGDKVGMAIFSKADCGMQTNLTPCHQQSKPCCDDEVIVHPAQDFKNTFNEFHLQPQLVAELVSPVVVSEIVSENSYQTDFTDYQPPARTCDLSVALQVFRI
jgi:hypothetical protein